jgi:hypothetical protein
MALGQEVGSLSGKVTGTRVLPPTDGQPKVEVSFEADGELNGVQAHVVRAQNLGNVAGQDLGAPGQL